MWCGGRAEIERIKLAESVLTILETMLEMLDTRHGGERGKPSN